MTYAHLRAISKEDLSIAERRRRYCRALGWTLDSGPPCTLRDTRTGKLMMEGFGPYVRGYLDGYVDSLLKEAP